MTASQIDPAQLNAYRQANYIVETGGREFILNVGISSADLEALHRQHGVQCSAVITAWNPFGQSTDKVFNRQANQLLKKDLSASGCGMLPCTGHDPDGNWNEPGFLALGLAFDTARKLGIQYKQNAILYCGSDAIPQLVLLR